MKSLNDLNTKSLIALSPAMLLFILLILMCVFMSGYMEQKLKVIPDFLDISDDIALYDIVVEDDMIFGVYEKHVEVFEYMGLSDTVVIPALFNGLPVTGMRDFFPQVFDPRKQSQKIILSKGIKNFGFYNMNGCNYKEIVLPYTLKNLICEYKVRKYLTGTVKLKEFTIAGNVLMEYNGDDSDVVIPEGITCIASYAFFNKPVRSVVFPESLKYIEESAFSGTELSSVVLPDGLLKIGNSAFRECSKLKSTNLPESLQYIGHQAFISCSSLSSVTIPKKLDVFRADAFSDTPWYSSLKGFYVIAGNGLLIKSNVSYSKNMLMPEGIKKICCTVSSKYPYTVETITLPESCEYLGPEAFLGCCNLININCEKLKEIDEYAFSSCTSLRSIDLSSIEIIREFAFSYHANITVSKFPLTHKFVVGDIDILKHPMNIDSYKYLATSSFIRYNDAPWGLNEQTDNDFITSANGILCQYKGADETVVIPDNVKYISYGAFSDNQSIKQVIIGNNVRFIGQCSFLRCSNLESVKIPDGVVIIADGAFNGCTKLKDFEMPKSIIYIGKSAFQFCSSLKEISLPDGIRCIYDFSFHDCTSLEKIEFGQKTLEILSSAFSGCTSLKRLDFPDSIRSIGHESFSDCISLESVKLPKSLMYVEYRCFFNCQKLNDINFSNSIPYLNISAFEGTKFIEDMKNSNQYNVFAGNLLSFPTKEKSIIIPEGVKCIPTSLFYDNNNIERIVFPKSLVSIGESAFEDCKSLKSVDISASALKTLPNKCFWGCISLKNFIFNKSLESCSHSSFGNSGLNEYRLPVSLKFFIMPYLPIYHPSFDVNKKIYIFVSGKDTVIYFNDWNNKYINNYIIYAPSGSAAEKSAHEIGIEFIPTD